MTISSKVCIGGMVRKLCTTQQIEKNSLSLELIVAILLIGSYSIRPEKTSQAGPAAAAPLRAGHRPYENRPIRTRFK